MLLREFIYFEKDVGDMVDDGRYDPLLDTTVIKSTDTRKSRLTLRMLNDLRKAAEARDKEKEEDLSLVRKMYATPSEQSPI